MIYEESLRAGIPFPEKNNVLFPKALIFEWSKGADHYFATFTYL